MFIGGTIVTLESRSFDADELWRTVEREQRHADGDRRRRVRASRWCAALEDAAARGEPYDLSSLAAHHQLGRDVDAPR